MSRLKTAAPWALSLALGAGLAYSVVAFYGGVVHFVGLRHLPGACGGCDTATAQSVVGLVQRANAAPVGSAQ